MLIQDVLSNLFNQNPAPAAAQQPAAAPAPQVPVNQPASMDGQQQQQQEGNIPAGQPQLDANGQPIQPAQPPASQEPANPLDLYASLFDNTNKEGEENLPPEFALSPEALNKAATSLDFTQGIDPEVMTKLAEGDLSALPALLNHVGQQAYSQALSHGTSLTGKYVSQYGDFQSKQVAPLVREQLTNQALSDSATGDSSIDMSNPIVKQAVAKTASELQRKNPTLPPQEIAQMAKSYYIELAASMLGANGDALAALPDQHRQQQESAKSQETNWDDYLS